MTREQKVSTLIQYLKQENQGYASIPDPIDEGEQRRLLRSLMNVRYPGHASAEYEKLQDELLQEEAEEKRNRDMQRYSSNRAGISMFRD